MLQELELVSRGYALSPHSQALPPISRLERAVHTPTSATTGVAGKRLAHTLRRAVYRETTVSLVALRRATRALVVQVPLADGLDYPSLYLSATPLARLGVYHARSRGRAGTPAGEYACNVSQGANTSSNIVDTEGNHTQTTGEGGIGTYDRLICLDENEQELLDATDGLSLRALKHAVTTLHQQRSEFIRRLYVCSSFACAVRCVCVVVLVYREDAAIVMLTVHCLRQRSFPE